MTPRLMQLQKEMHRQFRPPPKARSPPSPPLSPGHPGDSWARARRSPPCNTPPALPCSVRGGPWGCSWHCGCRRTLVNELKKKDDGSRGGGMVARLTSVAACRIALPSAGQGTLQQSDAHTQDVQYICACYIICERKWAWPMRRESSASMA